MMSFFCRAPKPPTEEGIKKCREAVEKYEGDVKTIRGEEEVAQRKFTAKKAELTRYLERVQQGEPAEPWREEEWNRELEETEMDIAQFVIRRISAETEIRMYKTSLASLNIGGSSAEAALVFQQTGVATYTGETDAQRKVTESVAANLANVARIDIERQQEKAKIQTYDQSGRVGSISATAVRPIQRKVRFSDQIMAQMQARTTTTESAFVNAPLTRQTDVLYQQAAMLPDV
jgi:hypothetical protein